jgi:hypothetical protein
MGSTYTQEPEVTYQGPDSGEVTYQDVLAEPFLINVGGRNRRYRICHDCGSLIRMDAKHSLISCSRRRQSITKNEGTIAPCGHYCSNATVESHLVKCSVYKTQINQV